MNQVMTLPVPSLVGSLETYIATVNRFPLLTRGGRVAPGAQAARRKRHRRRARFGRVASARGRGHRPRLPRLRPAARRSDPGRQHRPDEGGEALRPGTQRAPGVVCHPLDQGRNARVHPEELAPGQDRHHQGAAKAVLQPALDEEGPGAAVAGRDRRHGQAAPRQAGGSQGNGNAASPARTSPWKRNDDDEDSYAPDRLPVRCRTTNPRNCSNPTKPSASARRACKRRWRAWMRAAAASSKRAGCARRIRRRCTTLRPNSRFRPSASARSRPRRCRK